MSLPNVGSTLDSNIPRPVTYAVVSLLSVALYNVSELTFLLFLTFKRRKGLYFWSFFFATWGIAFYAIGFILKDFRLATSIPAFYVTLIVFGWSAMVTGQSMVLYSRLHLILHNQTVLRLVLGMIIFNAIVLHIPTIVLCYGANSIQYQNQFAFPYAVYERIQVSIFFAQEFLISSIYMYETWRLLRTGGVLDRDHQQPRRRLMLHLMYVNVIVVLLDTAILVLQFTGRYASQTAAKGLIYSVKLKLEYDILNQLVKFAQRGSDLSSSHDYGDEACFTEHREGRRDSHVDVVNHRRRCSCPWNIFVRKSEREFGRPAENRPCRTLTERSVILRKIQDIHSRTDFYWAKERGTQN
ncbi:conserved hypothetical protein [Aspergillus terreus NIH2624]|uniref:DUF7703 domain-containing protein n=1 Tax=Aspergillus terreus (strain NIH 2624 / FGSC A1156) TaxID=341663 RepID=Q0CLF7_ASPTN|nr:uncharacterized protein ATEG_05477 [Aspergillus terreus NIH2624]EAU34546.1 conserved hypothetical protein [Aspergillus terreus NIH2624]